ncbi:type IV secretory pathway VirB10-like protein [Nocardioides aromaticivorans]|uniref:Type IV secretory pathway VirB10-like protein n=1 Tax=Nocardioides aromaticivorans TaxID=200618 RepID=A0A7Z0CLM9_9ACTN|nr:hypothetical protein [Nocardioides aromaticivorans]NYI42930.1 type IV secretory pathway VirB10-like protein [Nocardioides aromaticivorans]
MGMRLSRIWLARGIAVGVIAFVVGAWAVGLAIGKDQPAKDRETRPASPESSLTPSEEPSVMGEVVDRPRPSDSATDELTDDPTDDPADVVPAAETDEPADDDPRTPKPSPKPSGSPKPSPSGKPTKTPSPTPSPTGPDCQDLGEVLDCVLAPITTRP